MELTLFTATGGNGNVTLRWITESELNNEYFNLYRSGNCDSGYEVIAQIAGNGTTCLRNEYTYIDYQVSNGCTYYYKIADVDINGVEEFAEYTISATPGGIGSGVVAEDYQLEQNYPNPFNASTTIRFRILQPGSVKLTVYDILGEQIAILIDQDLENNTYEVIFEAGDLPTGIYFCELAVNDFYRVNKMILVR